MTALRILSILGLFVVICVGVACAVNLAIGVQTANTPVECWGKDGAAGAVLSPTWEEQAYSRLRSMANTDPSALTDFHTIKLGTYVDGAMVTYWAWPYAIEQEGRVQCGRDSIGWEWENAALWGTGDWIGHCLAILAGALAAIAMSTFGCKVACELSDTHDWCDALDIALCLVGIVWPVGFVVAAIASLVYILKGLVQLAIVAGAWVADF